MTHNGVISAMTELKGAGNRFRRHHACRELQTLLGTAISGEPPSIFPSPGHGRVVHSDCMLNRGTGLRHHCCLRWVWSSRGAVHLGNSRLHSPKALGFQVLLILTEPFTWQQRKRTQRKTKQNNKTQNPLSSHSLHLKCFLHYFNTLSGFFFLRH